MEELLKHPLKARFRVCAGAAAVTDARAQLYRDSLRLAAYLAAKQGVPAAGIREQVRPCVRCTPLPRCAMFRPVRGLTPVPQVRAAFRANAGETNPEKIKQQRERCGAPACRYAHARRCTPDNRKRRLRTPDARPPSPRSAVNGLHSYLMHEAQIMARKGKEPFEKE